MLARATVAGETSRTGAYRPWPRTASRTPPRRTQRPARELTVARFTLPSSWSCRRCWSDWSSSIRTWASSRVVHHATIAAVAHDSRGAQQPRGRGAPGRLGDPGGLADVADAHLAGLQQRVEDPRSCPGRPATGRVQPGGTPPRHRSDRRTTTTLPTSTRLTSRSSNDTAPPRHLRCDLADLLLMGRQVEGHRGVARPHVSVSPPVRGDSPHLGRKAASVFCERGARWRAWTAPLVLRPPLRSGRASSRTVGWSSRAVIAALASEHHRGRPARQPRRLPRRRHGADRLDAGRGCQQWADSYQGASEARRRLVQLDGRLR